MYLYKVRVSCTNLLNVLFVYYLILLYFTSRHALAYTLLSFKNCKIKSKAQQM